MIERQARPGHVMNHGTVPGVVTKAGHLGLSTSSIYIMAEEVLAKREDDPAKTSAGPSGEGVGIIAASADIDKVTEASSSHSGSINAGRASQYGLNRGDLEEEVTQVIGVLSNWWGGVKKQVCSWSFGPDVCWADIH